MTLVEFLRLRLDEDEAAAKAWLPFGNPDDAARAHIARHDPARVLAEVEAKRRIIGLLDDAEDPCTDTAYSGVTDLADDALRLLALPYAGHPDYDEAWRP